MGFQGNHLMGLIPDLCAITPECQAHKAINQVPCPPLSLGPVQWVRHTVGVSIDDWIEWM